jgi:two-component system response regulator FixJ
VDSSQGSNAVSASKAVHCIFVADDNHLIRKLLGRQLETKGFKFRGFECGSELLEQAQAQPQAVQAIILDQTMPRLSGIEVAERLKQGGYEIPIILMSGDPYPIAERAQAIGVPILAKPFTFDTLHELLSSALRLS